MAIFYSNILPRLTVTLEYERAQATLCLAGELDRQVVPVVLNALGRVRDQGVRHVSVELLELTACDSAGIGALVQAWEAFHDAGGSLTLSRDSRTHPAARRVNAVLAVLSDVPADPEHVGDHAPG